MFSYEFISINHRFKHKYSKYIYKLVLESILKLFQVTSLV